ncbi:MAG TPA: hypothetical protein VF478_09670, partial [Anaerolineae bacterium]
MNLEEISSLYKLGPSETAGFEVETVSLNRLAEALAAFANAGGGSVLLGVYPQGGVIRGVKNPDAAIDKALAAGLRCDPPLVLPRPETAQLEG